MRSYDRFDKLGEGIHMAPMVQSRNNSETWPGFHFIRHALSVVILAFHSYVLTLGGKGNVGYVKGDLLATAGALTTKQLIIELLRPGLFALVAIFFALSGFLVMGSALRTRDLRRFFTLRALRILPALCTEVTLSALILGAIVTDLPAHEYFRSAETYSYFENIIGNMQYTLPGVFTQNPVPDFVNVNLWTLHAEFLSYLLIGGLMLTGVLYKQSDVTILIVAGTVLAAVVAAIPALNMPTRFDTTHFNSWVLVVLFGLGMLANLHRAVLPIKTGLFAICAICYFGLMISGLCDILACVLLTYIMMYAGSLRFSWFDRYFKDDCSYGIYLYGYPITQTLIIVLAGHVADWPTASRVALVMSLSIIVTFAFAFLSWRFIEQPVLKLKTRLLPRRVTTGPVTYADAIDKSKGGSALGLSRLSSEALQTDHG